MNEIPLREDDSIHNKRFGNLTYNRYFMNMDFNFQIMSLPHQRMYLMNISKDVVIRSSPGKISKFYAKERGGKEFELHHLSDLLHDTLKAARKITRVEYVEF